MNNSPAVPATSGGFGQIQAATMNWVNNTQFYSLVNPFYRSFYEQWVRNWLAWYDGYVPGIHEGSSGLLSSKIGTTIVNRATDTVLGGGLMFHDAHTPTELEEDDRGKKTGLVASKALRYITNQFVAESDFVSVVKRAIRNAFAGGSSLLKLNRADDGTLWLEAVRMDRFYASVDFRGRVISAKSYIASYNDTAPNGDTVGAFYIVEERFFDGKQPMIDYKVYRSSGQVNMSAYGTGTAESLSWSNIPRKIAQAIKTDYGTLRFGEPQKLPFKDSLGCELLKATDGISNLPQMQFGESILANTMAYLYLYDYYISALSGDMYLGRGRVLLSKPFQRGQGTGKGPGVQSNYNSGLDSFVYTMVETLSTEEQKPVTLQFDLRANDWKEIRNNLLESIATAIGISVGTLASYLSDASNRTAREISSEESATTLFVEEKRRLLEVPINRLLHTVTAYKGFTDCVEIRWSKAGFTNPQVQAQTLSLAVQSGLMSKKKAHRLFNVDEDQEQVEADWLEVQMDAVKEQNSVFGDFALNAGDVM